MNIIANKKKSLLLKKALSLFLLSIVLISLLFYIVNSSARTNGEKELSITAAKKNFKIFDANNYQGAPDLERFGLKKIEIIYEDNLTTFSKPSDKSSVRNLDQQKVIKQIHKLWNSKYEGPVVLDIETWDVKENTKKYIDALETFRQLYGKNDIGFFGHSASSNEISKISNIHFPVFYNISYNKRQWEENVIKVIHELKKTNALSPIYAFICPQYLINDRKATEFLDYQTWYSQLKFLYKYCDGVIIWGMPYYWDDKINNKVTFFKWDNDKEWWKATKDFIKNYNLK